MALRRKTKPPSPGSALIAFTLNGEPAEVSFAPHKTLLEVLREDLRLTGTKHGCELGECGTCAVLVDGEPVLSCLYLGLECEGRRVDTVEGMANAQGLHPLQKAFADLGAAQCGYCTPGFLLTAKALLERDPKPSREEIAQALAGNLCRCTGYIKIFEAVELAAAWMRGEDAVPSKETLYGRDFDESGLLPVVNSSEGVGAGVCGGRTRRMSRPSAAVAADDARFDPARGRPQPATEGRPPAVGNAGRSPAVTPPLRRRDSR